MYTVEFEADIENGIVHIPDNFVKGKKVHARVILLIDEKTPIPSFIAKDYFGLAHESKENIDQYLTESREDW